MTKISVFVLSMFLGGTLVASCAEAQDFRGITVPAFIEFPSRPVTFESDPDPRAPLLRLWNTRGQRALMITQAGTVELRNGALVSFDSRVAYGKGEFLAYIPVKIGEYVVFLPAYALPHDATDFVEVK